MINPANNPEEFRAPSAPQREHVTSIHGITRTDNYFWMRNKGDADVEQHLRAESAYTAAMMQHTEQLQQKLYDEMVSRMKQTDVTAPYRWGAYNYFSRTEEGKQYPIFLRQNIHSGEIETILDLNEMSRGHEFFALGAFEVSDDGNLLAFAVDTTGYRQYTLQVRDLRTGETLSDSVPRVTSVTWANDSRTLFLTTEDAITKRSDSFWRHELGGTTERLYYEDDELFELDAGRTGDREIIILESHSKTSSEAHYLRADQTRSDLTLILPREENYEYYADHDNGRFYFRTNKEAFNFRLVSAPVSSPASWTEIVQHNERVNLSDVTFFRDFIVLTEREGGLPHLRVIEKSSAASHRVSTAEPVYSLDLAENREYDADSINYSYASLVTPPSTISYDMRSSIATVLKELEVRGYARADYESERLWIPVRDGTLVPVALLYKRGVEFNGSAPLLLNAYGSYGASIEAGFSSSRVSLLDRGVVFALASIRGGGELGEAWREAGRMMKKMNTFTDFIEVAEWLIEQKYTARDRLVCMGGSAGGMLVGAVANMRPDLFRAVVAQVPFVDVVNTMLDASLPLTTSEYDEWGNPNEKPAFDYMLQYSPYDNVRPQAYPDMLIEISYNDSQVPYWEGAKFAAKIRELQTNKSRILVKVNMGAGHGGSSGRYDRLKEVAFTYSFVLDEVGKASQ